MSDDKEMLSQEEIDALLSQGDDEDEASDESSAEVELTSIEKDALGEIGNISLGSAATALATLVGQKVDITTPSVDVIHIERLADEFPHPHVAVHVEYIDGFKGTNLLVVKHEDAQIIADLMLGGEGTPDSEELSDMHISAVQEAMNQMMGSAATSMSTVFDKIVNISPPGIDVMDLQGGDQPNLDEEHIVKVAFRLRVGELIDSTIMQLIPYTFAKNMVEVLMGGEQDAEEVIEEMKEETKTVQENKTTEEPSASSPPPSSQPQPQQQPEPAAAQEAGASNIKGGQQAQGMSPPNVQPVQFSSFDNGPEAASTEGQNLNLLMDIPLNVTVELGRTKKQIKEILDMAPGSIIELDKLAGEPVDILVNNKLIAKGEVVVIDENFGVRVTDIISQLDRVQKLQ